MDKQIPVQQNETESNPQVETVLQTFIHTTDETEAQDLLCQLIDCAEPEIKKITRWSRNPEDAFQETVKRFIKKLWDLKADPGGRSISHYLHYVKVVARHVVEGQGREDRPQRRSQADALRHTFNGEPRFALWENENRERLCGLAAWRHQQMGLTRSEALIKLLDDPRAFDEAFPPDRNALSLNNTELLDALFNLIGHPIRFEELVRIVCDLRRIEDFTRNVDAEEGAPPLSELLPDTGLRPDEVAEWGEFLKLLWAEIEQLPPLQRIAYLLNLIAGYRIDRLFQGYNVAFLSHIGAALQLTDEHFARAWSELPWSDEE